MEYTVTDHALGADRWKKNQNGIKEDLIKYTKENGADAILITGMESEVRYPFQFLTKLLHWHVDSEITALFPKYKE